jgi:HTH-type transcriptional regulator / antitoxin HigA
MTRSNPSVSNLPRPPGYWIKQELDTRGWGQRDLAYTLGCHEQAVTLIVSGKRGISPEMAKALGAAFDVSPKFFLNLQSSYDLAIARDPDPGISRRARLQASYPVREMIRRGWLVDADATNLELQMARFFEGERTEDIPHLRFAGKKSDYDEMPPPQLAWLFRVRQIARSTRVGEYSSKKLRAALPELQQLLIEPEGIRQVPDILAPCGVRFILVEPLPQGKIDGACCWLDPDSPVIGMSLRYDRIDNFWFVLRHEIEHVLQEHGQDDTIGIVDELDGNRSAVDGPGLPEQELIANRAAAEFLIPQHELAAFIAQRTPYISERDVLTFAKRLDVHPGLVVGQIHSRTGRYDLLRRYLVKIRQFILPKAITDGWGHVFAS